MGKPIGVQDSSCNQAGKQNRRKNNPDVKSGLFLKNPSIAGAFKIKMVQLFFHRYIMIEEKLSRCEIGIVFKKKPPLLGLSKSKWCSYFFIVT
ncbi:MAG: hypothetical protein R2830_04120 [Saprospiraceae bacterium]